MPWFNVDDGFAFHRKAVRAGNAAIGLWTRAGSWCAQQLTDGFVPEDMVEVLGTANQARRLVAAGLWIAVDNGYQFHQFNEVGRNPSRESVLKKRDQDAEKKRLMRERKAGKYGSSQVDKPRPKGTSEGVPEGVPEGVGSIPSPPLPITTSPNGDVGATSAPATAQTILAEYLERCPKRPPKDVIGQVAKRVKAMLEEGIDPDDIRRGIAAWMEKALHPATLPSVVNEVMNRIAPTARPDTRPSTTDARVAAVQALKSDQHLRLIEGAS